MLTLFSATATIYLPSGKSEKDKFDLSRVPDVHDNVRYDVLYFFSLSVRTCVLLKFPINYFSNI